MLCGAEALRELRAREQKMGIRPDTDLDDFLKAISLKGQRSSLVTLLVMRLLGLEGMRVPALDLAWLHSLTGDSAW